MSCSVPSCDRQCAGAPRTRAACHAAGYPVRACAAGVAHGARATHARCTSRHHTPRCTRTQAAQCGCAFVSDAQTLTAPGGRRTCHASASGPHTLRTDTRPRQSQRTCPHALLGDHMYQLVASHGTLDRHTTDQRAHETGSFHPRASRPHTTPSPAAAHSDHGHPARAPAPTRARADALHAWTQRAPAPCAVCAPSPAVYPLSRAAALRAETPRDFR